MSGLGLLLLPWLAPHLVVRPQTRQLIATAIALAPPVCVLLGLALGTGLVLHDWGLELRGLDSRVVGLTGDPGLMAMLAFVGLAVAVHDTTVRGRAWTAALAVVDLGLVVATGDRPILLVTGVFLFAYLRAVPGCWRIWRRQAPVLAAAAIGMVLTLALARLGFGRLGLLTAATDAGRAILWPFFWHEFQASPWFGRGIGTQMVSGAGQLAVLRPTPHSTFLGLLVDVGVVGTVLIVLAVGQWGRQLWRATTGSDRAFVGTMLAALTILAVFDDLLLWPVALSIFVYFGVLSGRPASQPERVTAPKLAAAHQAAPAAVAAPGPVARPAPVAALVPAAGPAPQPELDMSGLLAAAAAAPRPAARKPASISAAQLAAVRRLAADDLWAWAAGPEPRPRVWAEAHEASAAEPAETGR